VVLGVLGGAARANVPAHVDGLIALQRGDAANGQIWVMDPTAASPEGTAVQVTTGPEPEARPAYGPTVDNTQWVLAFQRLADGDWDIWSRTTRGTTGEQPEFDPAVPLVTGPGDQTAPAYSRVLQEEPLLAYTSDQTGQREIWLRDTAGTLTRLTTDGEGYANPDFAGRYRPLDIDADGTIDGWRIGLAFESTRGGPRAIWALDVELDADGKYVAVHDMRSVASGPGDLSEPSWQVTHDKFDFTQPNSRVNNVLFTTAQAGSTYLDYVEQPWTETEDGSVTPAVPFADLTSVARFPLTGNPGGDDSAVWAPDGDQIAFVRTADGNSDVWAALADGTGLRRLTSRAGADLHPSWQPGSESSVDKVGGHTHPGPVDRDGGDGGDGGGGGGGGHPSDRSSPQLTIGRARWHARNVRVAGRSAPRLHGRLRVTFKCGRGAGRRTVGLVFSDGRFRTTLRARRACRGARRGAVVVAYGGDSLHTPDRVSRRVRRR